MESTKVFFFSWLIWGSLKETKQYKGMAANSISGFPRCSGRKVYWRGVWFSVVRKVIGVPESLWNTPLNLLPTGYEGIPFIVGLGDCLGCALRVCCNFLGLFIWQKGPFHNRELACCNIHKGGQDLQCRTLWVCVKIGWALKPSSENLRRIVVP